MYTTPEQFSAAAKTNFEAQIAALNALTSQAFANMTKIVDLNLNVAKASLEESSATAKQLLAAKDVQEFIALTSAHTQPAAEKALAYSRSLAGIASATQADFTKAAEEQLAESNRKVSEFIDAVTKNAPAGSEKAVAFFKTAFDNANAGYEQFSKSAKKAAETLQANVDTAVTQFAQTTTKATSRAKK